MKKIKITKNLCARSSNMIFNTHCQNMHELTPVLPEERKMNLLTINRPDCDSHFFI